MDAQEQYQVSQGEIINKQHEQILSQQLVIEKMRALLLDWDRLIDYQYYGSKDGMSAMQQIAFDTDDFLKGSKLPTDLLEAERKRVREETIEEYANIADAYGDEISYKIWRDIKELK